MQTKLPQQAKECLYSIYVYYPPKNNKCLSQWEKRGTTRNAKRAIKCAKLLQGNKQYKKIEIKKRFFSHKEEKFIGETTHIYKENKGTWENLFRFLTLQININKNSKR